MSVTTVDVAAVVRCARCSHPMHLTRKDPGQPGTREHHGRGICGCCFRALKGTDELFDYPRRARTRDEVLDDWTVLRAADCTRREAARRMGMNPASLYRALHRARHDGDPRAALGSP